MIQVTPLWKLFIYYRLSQSKTLLCQLIIVYLNELRIQQANLRQVLRHPKLLAIIYRTHKFNQPAHCHRGQLESTMF